MLRHAPSGLYLTRYRAYDPRSGRWLSRDPIGEAGGVNLYAYVGGNPVSFVDPLGLAGMYVYFEGYQVDTGLGFRLPLGHAGVVAINEQTGQAHYFEFGRYNYPGTTQPSTYGLVRDYEINTPLSFDSNGIPTQASSEALNAELSGRFGQGKFPATIYDPNADENKIIAFALHRQANVSEYPYTLNPFSSNQFNTCLNFAWDAFQAGRTTSPSVAPGLSSGGAIP